MDRISFSKMSDAEVTDYCRTLYKEHGIAALTYTQLRAVGVYFSLYNRGIKPLDLARKLDLEEEYLQHLKSRPVSRKGKQIERWTWDKIVRVAEGVVSEQGALPPAAWFQDNGYGSLVQAVYYLDKNWELLRDELDEFSGSSFVESRNGMRWRSHPEASLSNFLYARGIEHKRGERYPAEYEEYSGRTYGYYDLHIKSNSDWIDVEIWGEKPNGHDAKNYSEKRSLKEHFNSTNAKFLGIEFRDCFDDEKLQSILSSYIAVPEAYIFDRGTDSQIQSTHWSNADELIKFCRHLASQMPDGRFPTEEWLRKRGRYADRPGEVYNTASIYIKKWLGGVRKVRELLDQSGHSTQQWDRATALLEWKQFWKETGMTPGQARHLSRTTSDRLTQDQIGRAIRIDSAVLKYVGGAIAANKELGIEVDKTRKWTREAILDGYREIFDRWNVTPSQLREDHKNGKVFLEDGEKKFVGQLIDATGRQFEGAKEVYEILGITPPSRPRKRRKNKS
ncbi:MAG: hypothetical protein AAFR51_08855 [Pseudomonadota bacterium]